MQLGPGSSAFADGVYVVSAYAQTVTDSRGRHQAHSCLIRQNNIRMGQNIVHECMIQRERGIVPN